MKDLKRTRISFIFLFLASISYQYVVGQTDSISSNGYVKNREYPHRHPFSIQIGLGLGKYPNSITLDPIYNDYKNEVGFYSDINLSIPIPFTRYLAVNLKNCNIESIHFTEDDNKNIDALTFGTNDYQNWQEFDPNDQYGVLSYINNSLFGLQCTSVDYYKLSKAFCIGPSVSLPINKRWSNFVYFNYNFGVANLTSYNIKKTLSQNIFFCSGNADYSLITNEITQKINLHIYEFGIYLTAGKHLGISFGGSYTQLPTVSFNYKTELQSSNGTILNTKYKNTEVSYKSYNLFMRIGVRY